MGLFKKREKKDVNLDSDNILLRALLKSKLINREATLSIPAVASAVDLICNTFATIPFKLYKAERDEKGRRKVIEMYDDKRVRIINRETGDTLDGFQFKKAMCEDYLLGKGGYAYIKKINNDYQGLFYVADDQVNFIKNDNPIYKSFRILVYAGTYEPYQFLKLLRNTKDGMSGTGLTNELYKVFETAMLRIDYEKDLTATGGSRKGFLKSERALTKESMKALKQAWDEYYSGNSSTVILNEGMSFQEASNTSEQNEINEKTKTFNQEIRDVFHIGTNRNDFIKDAIVPIAEAFAIALNRELLLESEKDDGLYFAPDYERLVRGDIKERYETYQIGVSNGWLSLDEVREKEDMNRVDGLDIHKLGLGDVLLNAETGELYTPNTNATFGANEKVDEKVDETVNKDVDEQTDDVTE